jgi:NACalpha-BTF3-like transcription factor
VALQQFWTEELSMARLKLGTAAADIGMGMDPRDVELVMSQAGMSMYKAAKALKESGGDIVIAIMDLTN